MMGFLLSREGDRSSRIVLLLPFAVLLLAIAAYTAYWIYAAGEIRKWADAWIAEQELAGYEIGHGPMRVGGYPLRFTLDVRDPDIAAPPADGGWQARFSRLSASAMPWNFNHWIVTLGGPMTLAAEAGGRPALYEASAALARLSINSSRAGTQRIGIELEQAALDAIEGPEPALSRLDSLALTAEIDGEDRLTARFEALGADFSPAILPPRLAAVFGTEAGVLRFDGAVTQWSALAREGDAADWAAARGELLVRAAELDWGPADLGGTGELGLDAALRPAGRLSVVITDPDSLVDAMVEAGLVEPGQGDALRLAAMMAPRREAGIALPLRFQDGGIFLGPARIGSVGPVAG